MSELQRLILEDGDTTYEVLLESSTAEQQPSDSDYESYGPSGPPRARIGKGTLNKSGISTGNTSPKETRVQLQKVHNSIQGYTQYAIGAFKNLAVAEVEELNLKFNLKISAEGGLPVLANAKTEADFSIEVKCKFKDNQTKDTQPNDAPQENPSN